MNTEQNTSKNTNTEPFGYAVTIDELTSTITATIDEAQQWAGEAAKRHLGRAITIKPIDTAMALIREQADYEPGNEEWAEDTILDVAELIKQRRKAQ